MKIIIIDGFLDLSSIKYPDTKRNSYQLLSILYLELNRLEESVRYFNYNDCSYHKIREDLGDSDFVVCIKTEENENFLLGLKRLCKCNFIFISELTQSKHADYYDKEKEQIYIDTFFPVKKNIEFIIKIITKRESYQYKIDSLLYTNKIFFDNNTVSINVAEDAKKSFTITGIDTKPLSIDTIDKQINGILNAGVKHIKVEPIFDSQYKCFLLDISSLMKKYLNDYDFIWSCNIDPLSFCLGQDDLLIADSNLSEVTLLISNIDEVICEKFSLNYSLYDVISMIDYLRLKGVPYIHTDVILSSQIVPTDYNKITNRIIELYNHAPGLLDINLIFVKNEDLAFGNFSLYNYYGKKSKYNHINGINKNVTLLKQNIITKIFTLMSQSINIEMALKHMRLNDFNILTSYYIYFLAKSNYRQLYTFLGNGWFRLKDINRKDLSCFQVKILSYLYNQKDKLFLSCDAYSNDQKNVFFEINRQEYEIYKVLKSNKSISNAIQYLKSNNFYIEGCVEKFIAKLDNYNVILLKRALV